MAGAGDRRAGEALVSRVPFRIEAGYGRLYVKGADMHAARRLPGAAYNRRRDAYEVSLTLESLRRIKEEAGITSRELARCCSEKVMRWARAAHASRQEVRSLHERIEEGYRKRLPWYDVEGDDRPPFAHQEVMATVAAEISGCAFLAEMGTGKTRAAIEAAAYHARQGTVDVMFVVCPVAVMGTWEREARTWSQDLDPVRLEGRVKDRIAWFRTVAETLARGARPGKMLMPVTNYEVLYKMVDDLMALDLKIGMILDEGHRVRNPNAKVTKSAMKLATKAPWRVLMTGTPILNGVENIWSQWYVVDLGVSFGANYVQFRREFFDEDPWLHRLDPKPGTVSEVRERIQRRGLRYRKADCLDLPPKLYEIAEVEMTGEQSRAYDQMEQELIVRLSDLDSEVEEDGTVATAPIQLTQILRLTQITSGFLPNEADGGVRRFDPNPKLELLDDMVREYVGDGNSVIVWAWYKEDVRAILERLSDLDPVKIAGGMKSHERDEAEARFQAGDSPVLVGNPASAGVGLDLWRGSAAFYYSQGYNLEHRSQSEDRCHRSGSEIHDSVTYVDLSCRGTIDEAVREALAGKLELADAVTAFRQAIGVE